MTPSLLYSMRLMLGILFLAVTYTWSTNGEADDVAHSCSSGMDGSAEVCVANSSTEDIDKRKDEEYYQLMKKCKIFVAPSTIPNAGLGIFTSVPIKSGELIGYGDMVIPLPRIASTLPDPFEDYTWNGRVYGGPLNAFAPGLQSLMNSNLALLNVHQLKPATNVFADSIDATPYHYLEGIADQFIPAGGELFSFYGDHWFEGRQDRFGHDQMPLSDDYPLAENLTKSFFRSVPGQHEAWHEDLWELIKLFPIQSRILRALPGYQDITRVAESGIRSLFQPEARKDVEAELIQSNGQSRCLDFIRPGPSLVHALGAFATRDLPEGFVISGSPLLHTSKERWNEHGQVWNEFTKSYQKSYSGKENYALLINYCWGHIQSSLLLCPYGIGVSYINHASSETDSNSDTLATDENSNVRPTPNVRIQWAPNGQISHNAESLTKTPEELWSSVDTRVSLAIDYVTTRPIKEGEELFVDYGSVWGNAYESHASNKGPSKKRYTAEEWNNRLGTDVLLLTEAEQSVRPYPEHLEFKCHPDVMTPHLHFNQKDVWKKPGVIRNALDCQILERQTHPQYPEYITYAVRVFYDHTWRGRAGIPREYIRFFEKEGVVLSNPKTPFRLEMQLPDHMVPDIWRDLV